MDRFDLNTYRRLQKRQAQATASNASSNSGSHHALNSTLHDKTRPVGQSSANPSLFPSKKQPEAGGSSHKPPSSRGNGTVNAPGSRVPSGEQQTRHIQRGHGPAARTKKPISSSNKKFLNLNKSPVKKVDLSSLMKKHIPSGSSVKPVPMIEQAKELLPPSNDEEIVPSTTRTAVSGSKDAVSHSSFKEAIALLEAQSMNTNVVPQTERLKEDYMDVTTSAEAADIGTASADYVQAVASNAGLVPQDALDATTKKVPTHSESPMHLHDSDGERLEMQDRKGKGKMHDSIENAAAGPSNIGEVGSAQVNAPSFSFSSSSPSAHSYGDATPSASILSIGQNINTNRNAPISTVANPPSLTIAANTTVVRPATLSASMPRAVPQVRDIGIATQVPERDVTTRGVNTDAPPFELQAPPPQASVLDEKALADRIAERILSLLQPAVAEVGQTQQGMKEMMQNLQGRLDAFEKERQAVTELEPQAAQSNDMDIDIEEVAGPDANKESSEKVEEEGTGVQVGPEDTIKSILILADRIHTVVEDLGVVKRVLGADNLRNHVAAHNGQGNEENILEKYAQRGRKRRKIDAPSLNGEPADQEEELILVDGTWKPLSLGGSSNAEAGSKGQSRSILERLDSMEMDLQECLEKASDPFAAVPSEEENPKERGGAKSGTEPPTEVERRPVVRHEMGTSPIRFPEVAKKPKSQVGNVTRTSVRREATVRGKASTNAVGESPTKNSSLPYPGGLKTVPMTESTLSLLTSSSGTSFVEGGFEQNNVPGRHQGLSSNHNVHEGSWEQDTGLQDIDMEEDGDVFGPFKLNPSSIAGSSPRSLSPPQETRLRNLESQSQRQKVDEDGDANNASSSAPDVVPFRQSQIGNVVDGDSKRPGQDFESEANDDAGMPISGKDSDLNVSGSSQKLVLQSKGRRDNKGSAFSPVDWSKTSESPETSSTTRVVQITPKVKLKLTPPHLKGTETTPTPSASVRPFKPATPQDIATKVTPSRSYTLPALPEGSVAALRQQTFGTPYLDFDKENRNNRTAEMDQDGRGRVQMVIGADAGERMLSPESQLSGEDEEESETEQERDATANAGQVQESGGNTSDMPMGQDGSSMRDGQLEQENESIPKSQASLPNTPAIMVPSDPSIPPPPSQTADEEAVANSLVTTLSQSSNAQNDSIPSPLEAPLVDHRDEIIPSSCSPPPVQQNNHSLPKSPMLTSPGAGTYDTSHMDDHDDFENTENDIVKAKEELNTPRQMPTASTEYLHVPSASSSPPQVKAKPKPKPKPKAEIVAKQEIIDIDSLPTPKKIASKGKKKVQASNRESSIISISSDSEIEVIDPIPSTRSLRPSNSAASRKQRPSLKLMNRKLPVKLDIFTQPDPSSSRTSPISTPSQLQMPSSSSGNKRTEVGESTADVDFETTDHKAEEVEKPALEVPVSPSTPSFQGFSSPRNFSQQGSSPSPRVDNIEPHVPSSPLSEPPSDSESKSDAEPTSSFDIAKYTAKLEDDDDADIIRAKPKSVGTDTTKTGLQAMIANKKKAKENSKALTKIKKRKRVSDPTSLRLGSGIDGEGEEDMMDKPPLKRVKARTQAQKENESAGARKGKAKEPEKDKSRTPRARQQVPDEESHTSISSQSRYPLRSPRKSASTSISATSSSARATKTPVKKSRVSDILKSVKWPVIPEPDFSQHIECDTCEGWYHIGCVGVAANDVRLRPSAVFKCPMCEAGINKQTSPIKNVLENDFKGKNDCARPDCLRQTMRSKSKKLSPSVSTTPRARGRPRKIEIKEESSASPTDNDEYVVESFVGRSKKYVGGRGLVVDYLVKWLDYDYEDATWQSLDSMGLTNPDILLEAFDQAARAQGYDLQNSNDEVFLLNGAAEAGWTLEKTFVPRKRK